MYYSGGETCHTECWPERGYVIKQFRPRKPKFGGGIDPLRDTLELSFYREITCLERLQGNPRFPQIIHMDPDNLTIRMSWVGRPFKHFAKTKRDTYLEHAEQIVASLSDASIDVAYEWQPGDGKPGYCLSMMMVDGHDLNLIDFERAWPHGCARQHEFNSQFRHSFRDHDNVKFLETLRREITTTETTPPPKGTYETE